MVVYSRMPGWWSTSSRDMRAMSWAEVTWPWAGRPVQLRKVVSPIPSSLARRFICSTKAVSLPARYSAIATAASLPETTVMHFTSSPTVICSPSFR